MCVRYFIDRDTKELAPFAERVALSPLCDRFRSKLGKSIKNEGEIGPMDIAPVIATSRGGASTVFPMQWGFNIKRTDLASSRDEVFTTVFNARAESAGRRPAFAEAWRKHRCIVPASWYFEWEHALDPNGKKVRGERWSIQPRGDTVTWLCGLYRMEEGLPRFVVLTREPSFELSKIHDRMPLMLPLEKVSAWIDPGSDPEEVSKAALERMILWQ